MSSVRRPSAIKQLWFRWKALRLPWRRTRLVGSDLAGNTFWEFKDALNANRLRRIMKHAGPSHFADVKISPQWHQWLRHTRDHPPSLEEQQYDLSRQAMMKQLAAEADERWRSKPSLLDSPSTEQPVPAIGVRDPGGYTQPSTKPAEGQRVVGATDNVAEGEKDPNAEPMEKTRHQERPRERESNPYQRQQRGAPSENWQPQSWTPGTTQRR